MNQYSNLVSMHGQFPCAPQMYGLSSRSRDSFLLLIGPATLSSTLYVCSVPYTSGVLVVPMSSRLARLPLVSRSSSAHSAQLSSNSCAAALVHLFTYLFSVHALPFVDFPRGSTSLLHQPRSSSPTRLNGPLRINNSSNKHRQRLTILTHYASLV